jgi:transcriptional regulator with XRE-family HTH domain
MDRKGRTLLAKNLQGLRELYEMTQEDLAGAAEIDRSYVSMIENGKFAASIDMIEKIADAFHVAIDEMLHPDTLETVKARLGK